MLFYVISRASNLVPISRPVPFIYLFHKTRPWVRLHRGEPYCCFNLKCKIFSTQRRREKRFKFAECYMTRSIYNIITNSSQRNLAWYCRLQGPVTLWCSKPILSLSPRNQFELKRERQEISWIYTHFRQIAPDRKMFFGKQTGDI